MYLAVVFVAAIILVMMSPVLWVVWWLIADLGEGASGTHSTTRYASTGPGLRRAA
jgi:hypothetical protein